MWQQKARKGECFKEGGVNCVNAAEWLRKVSRDQGFRDTDADGHAMKAL